MKNVAPTSYYEHGSIEFIELTKGRIVLTEDSDVEVINVTKKDANTYNNPIIADGGVLDENMPEIISRDQVTVTDTRGKTELVQIQTLDADGNVIGTAEQVFAYADGTAGTTEKTAVQNTDIDTTLGIIVLDSNGHAGQKAYSESQKETKIDEVAGDAINASVVSENPTGVARIGRTAYPTFEDAVTAAQNKSVTIVLLKDIDLTNYTSEREYMPNLSGDTLDLDGHKITNNNYAVAYTGDNVVIQNGTFEVTNNGSYAMLISQATMILKNVSTIGGINVHTSTVEIYNGSCNETKGTDYYALWADFYATIIVYSGNFSSPSTCGGCVLNAVANDSDSSIIVKGGEFEALGTANMFSTSANIVVEGGTFNKEVPSSNYSSPFAVKNNNNGTWTVYNSASYMVVWSQAAYTSIANKTDLDAAIAADSSNVYLNPHGLSSSLDDKYVVYTSDEVVGWGCTPSDVYNAYGSMWTAAACPKMWFTYSSETNKQYFDSLEEAQVCATTNSGTLYKQVNGEWVVVD